MKLKFGEPSGRKAERYAVEDRCLRLRNDLQADKVGTHSDQPEPDVGQVKPGVGFFEADPIGIGIFMVDLGNNHVEHQVIVAASPVKENPICKPLPLVQLQDDLIGSVSGPVIAVIGICRRRHFTAPIRIRRHISGGQIDYRYRENDPHDAEKEDDHPFVSRCAFQGNASYGIRSTVATWATRGEKRG